MLTPVQSSSNELSHSNLINLCLKPKSVGGSTTGEDCCTIKTSKRIKKVKMDCSYVLAKTEIRGHMLKLQNKCPKKGWRWLLSGQNLLLKGCFGSEHLRKSVPLLHHRHLWWLGLRFTRKEEFLYLCENLLANCFL